MSKLKSYKSVIIKDEKTINHSVEVIDKEFNIVKQTKSSSVSDTSLQPINDRCVYSSIMEDEE
jgi:hypothetical protein